MVPFLGGCDALKGVPWAVEKDETEKLDFSAHLRQLKGYSAFTDFIKNQSIGAAWGVLDTLVWIFEYLTDWLFAGPLSVDFWHFFDISKKYPNFYAMGIRNFDPQIGMKVSIYLTQNKKNSEFFSLVGLPSYGRPSDWPFRGRNVNSPFTAWRVDDRGTVSLVICRGPFYLPKGTFWEFLRFTVLS